MGTLGEFEGGTDGEFIKIPSGSYIRFYAAGFRELVHRDGDKWYLSLALGSPEGGLFSKGRVEFNSSREAREWADNRDFEDEHWLSVDADELMKRYKDN